MPSVRPSPYPQKRFDDTCLCSGWLEHEEDGRTFRYRATITREDAQTKLAREFHERVFDGSSASLVRCLVEADGLDEAEIAELRKILNEAARRIRK